MENAEPRHDLEERTTAFAVAVIDCVSRLGRSAATDVIARQLVRSATSIGANYREANRAESRDDFIHKTAIIQKEAAETEYWFELCRRAHIGAPEQIQTLSTEARELLAIFTTINRKAKGR